MFLATPVFVCSLSVLMALQCSFINEPSTGFAVRFRERSLKTTFAPQVVLRISVLVLISKERSARRFGSGVTARLNGDCWKSFG